MSTTVQHRSRLRLQKVIGHLVLRTQSCASINNDSSKTVKTNRSNDDNKSSNNAKVAVIMGAGTGLGAAVAKKFALKGFVTIVARRTQSKVQPLVDEINANTNNTGKCYGFGVDARKEEKVVEFVAMIERTYGPIEVAVYNPGANVKFPICETTSRVYFKVWEMACFGGFLFGRECAKHMLKRKRGCIIFSGATASVRGAAGFAAFSGGKQALRSLAQSMARELGPKGIHIAHIVIDGGIDTPFIRNLLQSRNPNLKISDLPKDALLQPDGIADNYWHLYQQPRNAWTFEMDVRPYCEKW